MLTALVNRHVKLPSGAFDTTHVDTVIGDDRDVHLPASHSRCEIDSDNGFLPC